jgi:hypothetical protein
MLFGHNFHCPIVALFFCHLQHLLCHFTISIISIVLTDVFWFKKEKLPSYQVREEDLVRIWLVKTLNRKRLKGIISD